MSVVYKKLEEVCEILDSQRVPITAKDRKSGIYPYYGANGLQDHVSDYIFDDELVLLAEDGGNFGSKNRPIAYRVSGKCWVNNHAHVLKAKSNIHIDYLCYALMFYNTDGLVNGATRQKLTQAAMRQVVIPYRCMKEQEQIVAEISRVFHLIAVRNEELALLEQLVKSRFIELFGSQCHNEKNYPYGKIDDVAEIYLGLTHTPEYIETGVKFISAKNTSCDYLDLSDVKYISKEEYASAPAGAKPCKGDVLFSRVGSNLGHPVILDIDEELCTFVSLGYLRTKGRVTNLYLKHWMRDDFFAEQVRRKVVGGGQPNLNTGWLKEFRIIIPPMDLQEQFATFVEQTDKSKYFACQTLSFLLKLANNLQSWREKQYDY